MLLPELTERLVNFVREVPRLRIHAVLEHLRSGRTLQYALLRESVTRRDATLFQGLMLEGFPVSSPFLAQALDALYVLVESSSQTTEIVWTGPKVDVDINYAQTFVLARDLVSAAKRRVLFAGYRVTVDTLDRLGVWAAVLRGVVVRVVVNDADLLIIDRNIMLANGVEVFRVRPLGDSVSKFHAKALLVDGLCGIVGSANFTLSGQSRNIEIGVTIQETTARQIEALLDTYIRNASLSGWLVS